MNRPTHGNPFGPRDRIAAFAEATEVYAESLDDPDLANVYWGKSLGLWQALVILSGEEHGPRAKQVQGPPVTCAARRADRTNPSVSVQPLVSHAALPSQEW